MKKFIKSFAVIAVAAVLIVVGVFAARIPTFSTTSTVSFSAIHAFVDITGDVYVGNGTIDDGFRVGTQYTGATYTDAVADNKPNSEAGDWGMGNLEFTDVKTVITVVMTFENVGATTVTVVVTPPTAPTGTALTLSVDGEDELDPTDADDNTFVIESGEDVVFIYTLTLEDFVTSFSGAGFNFEVTMTATTPATPEGDGT